MHASDGACLSAMSPQPVQRASLTWLAVKTNGSCRGGIVAIADGKPASSAACAFAKFSKVMDISGGPAQQEHSHTSEVVVKYLLLVLPRPHISLVVSWLMRETIPQVTAAVDMEDYFTPLKRLSYLHLQWSRTSSAAALTL